MRHQKQLPNFLSNTPGGLQPLAASQPSDLLNLKPFLSLLSEVGCCVALHPLGSTEHETT